MSTENQMPKVGDLVQITYTNYAGNLAEELLSKPFNVSCIEFFNNQPLGFYIHIDNEDWYFSPNADEWIIVEEKS